MIVILIHFETSNDINCLLTSLSIYLALTSALRSAWGFDRRLNNLAGLLLEMIGFSVSLLLQNFRPRRLLSRRLRAFTDYYTML